MSVFPHTVIRASAGTGKTFQLSNRFLGLIAAGATADDVLATTFARKAAGEILDRVLSRLAESIDDPKKLRDLARHLGDESFDRPRCAELLQQLIRRMHRLRIGTLDAFFIQLAGSFGLDLGIPPGWHICDELIDAGMRWEAIQEVLRRETTNDVVELMHLLHKGELRRSVCEEIESVVTDLYGQFLETDRAAWHALGHRKPLSEAELTEAIGAFEAHADFPKDARIPKSHTRSLEQIRAGDWAGFLAAGMAIKIVSGEENFCSKPIGDVTRTVYEPFLRHAQAVLINRIAEQTASSWRLLDRFDQEYRRLKRERRALRFEDVTRELAHGLSNMAGEDVAWRLDAHIAHLLLDEFQDTSLPQWTVLKPSAERITALPGDAVGRDSFFCVGDVKQAIYGWRGGISAVFDAVTDRLPHLHPRPLNESYRSSPPVIETVNAVFSRLDRAAPLDKSAEVVDAWKTRFALHTTALADRKGYCRMVTSPRAAKGGSQAGATLDAAAKLVAELHRLSPERSIGVLVRRNDVVTRMTYLLREKHGIDASEEGGNPLTDSTGVQMMLAALRMADHPGNLAARFLVADSPLAAGLELPDWTSLPAALKASRHVREALLRDGYGRTVYSWAKTLAPTLDERELQRMLQLVELAYRYESQSGVRADAFVRFVEETKVEDPSAALVRVMNIHQSKGLEFDVVVLPELDSRLAPRTPPFVSGRDDALGPITRVIRYVDDSVQALLPASFQKLFTDFHTDRMNENLCVLYVAMTRAIHEMHLVIAPSKENEKSVPGTYAGILRTTLGIDGRIEPETVLYECGDPDWRRVEDAVRVRADAELISIGERVVAADGAGDPSHGAVRLAPSSARRPRGLRRQSPSAREGGGYVRLERKMRLESSYAMARGTLIHKWFEQVEWLDHGSPAETRLRDASIGLLTSETDLKRELAAFREMLERPAIREALSRSGYRVEARPSRRTASISGLIPRDVLAGLSTGAVVTRVEPERQFAYRTDTEIVPGSIDRLVTFLKKGKPVAAEILDFKTDAVGDPDKLKDAVDTYRPQMQAYREAVARFSGIPAQHIGVRLLFVGEGTVVDV